MRSTPVLLAAMISCAAVMPALAAPACVPSVTASSHPACIALVGTTSGTADAAGEFTVIVRDLASIPVANSVVTVDFAGLGETVHIAPVQPDPNLVTDCTQRWVRTVTDHSGVARFRIVGSSNPAGSPPYMGSLKAKIYADGIQFREPNVLTYDQDGADGVNATDLGLWLADKFGAAYIGRSDYDCDGALGPNDLSLWLGVKFGGGSSQSSAASCQ